ncbi:MAG: SH3 domain-containing protein [Phormidesmis sp.]
MFYRHFHLSLFVLVLGALSATHAHAEERHAQVVSPCPFGSRYPDYYVRITTNDGDPLRVRSSPNGTVIGAAENGWNVRLLEWSRDGAWVRILSPWDSPNLSATPYGREGWVSAAYVKEVGRFCEKPRGVGQLVQPEVLGAAPVQVQGDWLAAADGLFEDALYEDGLFKRS